MISNIFVKRWREFFKEWIFLIAITYKGSPLQRIQRTEQLDQVKDMLSRLLTSSSPLILEKCIGTTSLTDKKKI